MQRFLLVSPNNPTGSSWLANCFLEFNIRLRCSNWHEPFIQMNNKYHLNHHSLLLKALLPSIRKYRNVFDFRTDIECDYSHAWFHPQYQHHKAILFVRDPRDSLYSKYLSLRKDITFEEYVSILDPYTLLNLIDENILYIFSWLEHPNVKIVRFEDYRKNPEQTLLNVLDFLELQVSTEDLERASESSSYQKAKEAQEELYRHLLTDRFEGEADPNFLFDRFGIKASSCLTPNEMQEFAKVQLDILNRHFIGSGKVGGGKYNAAERETIRRIEKQSGILLKQLQYEMNEDYIDENLDYTITQNFPVFKNAILPIHLCNRPDKNAESHVHQNIIDFVSKMNADNIRRWYKSYTDFTALCGNLLHYLNLIGMDEGTQNEFVALYHSISKEVYNV